MRIRRILNVNPSFVPELWDQVDDPESPTGGAGIVTLSPCVASVMGEQARQVSASAVGSVHRIVSRRVPRVLR
jgi:hypothetical protein